ncbi:hypothetical protein FEE95_13230 [Maribacter algarum]|uniref:Uncharacterized protein n=1 Tax=Maribacter algarum (ex Zhang et al. 2020) TaxID=2578118 RepID=A0A5S3PRV2_9FLAO|nr:hypothetical protein [Maribacter algarum]TMM57442.1 hypothetical protein FEE95_13230 [Maribacter algarum]
MKFGLFYFLSILPFISLAQQEVLEVRGSVIEIGILVDGLNDSKYANADGSPYLNSEFIPAKVNDIKKTQFIRYNVVDQIFEVQIKTNKVVMLDLKNDFSIQLLDGSDKKYRTAMYSIDGKRIKSFFEVVKKSENFILYKQERKKYLKAQKAEGYQDKLPERFVDEAPTFYISNFKSDSPTLLELPNKKKKFVAFFEQQRKAVEKFMKQEKLGIKEPNDLVRIMDFVFSITQ